MGHSNWCHIRSNPVNYVHTKRAWGKHTVCLCILDNSLVVIFLLVSLEFSAPTGNQGEVDPKPLTGHPVQVPSHLHMRRPYMHHQPVLQQTSILLNNKKSFRHFQSALTTGFIIRGLEYRSGLSEHPKDRPDYWNRTKPYWTVFFQTCSNTYMIDTKKATARKAENVYLAGFTGRLEVDVFNL